MTGAAAVSYSAVVTILSAGVMMGEVRNLCLKNKVSAICSALIFLE